MLCVSSYLFFKNSFLGSLLASNVFIPYVTLENSRSQNAIHYFIFKKDCFTSRVTATLLTVIADKIARVLTTSGASQAVVLDIFKVFYRILHAGLFYKYWLYGIMKKYFKLLSYFVVVEDFELI